ncbi:MAG TPA: TolC family protein [Bryobacteraceae bacterium]|jgi:outer membrane protein TolC
MSRGVWRSLALVAAAGAARLAWCDSFPLLGSFERRFHPDTVIERDVEGLEQHIQGGKLVLNLKAFLALALKNSTGIRLTELDVYTAADAVTSAKAPFDPQVLFQFDAQRSVQQEASQTSGAETLSDLGQTSTASYSQVFGAGPTVTAGFNATRTSSNSAFNFFNPSVATGLNFSVTQPLLQNRGNLQIRAPLLVARTQFRIVTEQSQAQIATTIANAAGQYWEAIRARENIRVLEQSLDLAQKSYERDRQALELGALSKLDILQSQSQVAQRKLDLIQGRYGYQQALDGLRQLIGADLKPDTLGMEIVLEDDPREMPVGFHALPLGEAIAKARHDRPELSAAGRRVGVDELNARVARDQMTPRLDLSLQAGSSGLGGNQLPVVLPLGGTTALVTGGLGDSLNQLFGFASPYYGFSLTLGIPVRSSAAQASLTDALVNRVRDRYSQRQIDQQVILDVETANRQLDLAQASMEAAKTSRDLSQQNVDAEQMKYQLGTVTAFELLTAQSQLATTENSLVNAYVDYQKAVVAYRRAIWTTLDDLGFVLEAPAVR